MEKRTIALDFDNVLSLTTELMALRINEEFGTRYKVTDVKEWSYFQKVMGWTSREELDMFEKVWLDERLVPSEPGLDKIIKKIKDMFQCRISIISMRTPTSVDVPVRWMKKYNIEYDEYIGIVSQKPKHEYQWDVIIDDAIHNIEPVKYPRVGIIFNQPWNVNYLTPLRINKLSELPNLLQYEKVI